MAKTPVDSPSTIDLRQRATKIRTGSETRLIYVWNGKFSQRNLTDDFWNNAPEIKQIGNGVEGGNNLFSYKTLGSDFWKAAREAEGRRIWNQIEETLVLPDPGDSLFVPGAKEHYYMEDAYELNLNSMDSSTVDSENIQTCLKRKSNDEVTILEPNEKSNVYTTRDR
ncbi:hypothetical protein MJO29_005354 [Puccinia striiformis f. sp. tritici]|nr:hypothetical protein MJO29_005354 [Puccinia striiformis f. sp. tritici]